MEPKARVSRGGTLALSCTHRFTTLSSTSTIWFLRSLPYMVNLMVFKVSHMVQSQPWTQSLLFYWHVNFKLIFCRHLHHYLYRTPQTLLVHVRQNAFVYLSTEFSTALYLSFTITLRNQTQLFGRICLGLPPLPPSHNSPPSRRTYNAEVSTLLNYDSVSLGQLSRVLGLVDSWRSRHCFLSKRREPITQTGSVTPQKKRNLNHAVVITSHKSHSLNFPPKCCPLRPPPSSPTRWAGLKYASKSYDYWVMTTFVMATVGRSFDACTAIEYHRNLN
jgi:hypothetical protein